MTDIYSELNGSDPDKAPEYFIGSIVVCPGTGGVFDLIDGQQRMTTLFVVLCAIRDRFKALGEKAPGPLDGQIATISADARGRDVFRYRMALQYEDSGHVLIDIAEASPDPADGKKTRSIKNILDAYAAVMSFLSEQFADDVDALRVFYGYFINKVKLIRIQTEDVAKALKIFETINDRGIGLDSMDLLKNLLFMKSAREKFELLKELWKELQDTIFKAGEKPLRFLRYFILRHYKVEVLREDEIYGWFSGHEKLCGYAENPLGFAGQLLDAAKAYANFLKGCDLSGKQRPELESLQHLGGSAARQHLVLLLAGRHLPEELFSQLVREVENLFFVYVVTRENTRNFERKFAQWAQELKEIKTEGELNAFLEERIKPEKASLAARFDDAFKRMDSNALQVYRMRYVLAKLNQHLEISAHGETEGTRWLKHYADSNYEIEHIHPQNPRPEAIAEFGEATDLNITNKLGNLVLLEKPINASLGNKPYSHKKLVYPKSQILLVKGISEQIKIGVNTRIDRAMAQIKPFGTWNETSVLERQAMLGSMAHDIWNIPILQQ